MAHMGVSQINIVLVPGADFVHGTPKFSYAAAPIMDLYGGLWRGSYPFLAPR